MRNKNRFTHVGPEFAVRDVSRAASFYSKILGFDIEYLKGNPPEYAVVFKDEVYIHLSLSNDPIFNPGGGKAFIAVSRIEEIWRKVRSEAPESIFSSLEEKDYGQGVHFQVFIIKDPDGNTLRIAEPTGKNIKKG